MEKMVAGGETAAEARTPPAAVIVGSFGDGSKAVDKDGTDAAILVVEGTQERNKKVSAPVAAIPHTPQVSSKNWRKIRSAVVALAAFRSRRVKATDFERIRLCGEGGSGLVYLVQLKKTTMFFALKVQRKGDLEAKEKRIQRALIEREVLVACAHPFVCSLYTAFQDTRHLYLLMDFCAGGDLSTLIRDVVKRPLTEDEARFYICEIVAALEWIHLHGYVYRDLKPENVLIHESGHIRLGDFGTAERGSMRCGDLPSEKLRPEDVEGMLCEHSVVSEETGLTSGSGMQGTGAEEMASMLMDTSERSSGGGVVRHSQDTDGGDEEADIDASAYLAGGALDKTRCHNNIVVQIDPVLEAVSSPSTRSKPGSSAAAANSVGASANSIGTQEMGRVANGRNGVRPGGDNPVMAGHPGGCCGRRGRRRRDSEERGDSAARPEQSRVFSRGQGSVMLNVLLDSHTFIGTADFMAPEMVTGEQRQGAAMDWWALGVMLYEMILGQLPFHTDFFQTSNDVFRSIVLAELTFPRHHTLSRPTVHFIRELMRKNPAERLGQREGVGEIKRHPFFSSIHWALIANSTPPFVVSGPDTPGWAAQMASAPAGTRLDKLAKWTWNVTQEELRPSMPVPWPPRSEEAQKHLNGDTMSDELDSPSLRFNEADLSKLGDELGISATAVNHQPGQPEVANEAQRVVKSTTKEGAESGGADDHFQVNSFLNVQGPPKIAGGGWAAADAPGMNDERKGKSDDTSTNSFVSAEDVSTSTMGVSGSASSAAAAAAAALEPAPRSGEDRNEKSGGDVSEKGARAPTRPRLDASKASFDGYDFNTLRKVGSFAVGRSGKGLSQLSSRSSTDIALGGKP